MSTNDRFDTRYDEDHMIDVVTVIAKNARAGCATEPRDRAFEDAAYHAEALLGLILAREKLAL